MSQANVQLVGRVIDAFNRRELDQALQEVVEDFEMDWSSSRGPHKGIYRGHREVEEVWTRFQDAWSEVRWEPQEFIEVDQERVIVVNRVLMRGRGSGVDVDATGAQLWTIEGGRGRQVKLFQSKADALTAVGRPE